jgi:hypothetical protein
LWGHYGLEYGFIGNRWVAIGAGRCRISGGTARLAQGETAQGGREVVLIK